MSAGTEGLLSALSEGSEAQQAVIEGGSQWRKVKPLQ